jgi:CO dehydrogenase nickel-insertion accessory protein CooC1
MQADPSRGCIITFYSYKGGTGRTMALANVACLLADAGDEVLVVDWDLEAPGLHRFLPPRLRASSASMDLGLDDAPGVIDLFSKLRDQLPPTPPSSEEEADAAVEHAFTGVDLDAYVSDTAVPSVRIMRAGRNDDGGYSRRVGTFDWEAVFQRAPGIYRAFADRLTAKYRWVLVDSRTGVTDISGICTSLLPERLVVVFTPNRQSLTGVRELVLRATEYRRSSDDLRPLLVYPLPSRIEASLQDLRTRWRFGDPDRDVIGYEPMFQDLMAKAYGLPRCDLSAYFDEVQIQQTPDYAYGEEIAVRRTGDRFSMANSYIVFMNRLKTGEPPWLQLEPIAQAPEQPGSVGVDMPVAPPKVSSSPPRLRSSPPRTATKDAAPVMGPQVFLSYASADRERIIAVAAALSRRNLRVQVEKTLEPGSDYSSAVSQQLDASDAIVVFWSRDAIESGWVKTEAEEGMRRGILVPVLLDDVAPPLAFRSVQSADLRRPTPEALEKLADAVARVALATPGTIVYSTQYQSSPATATPSLAPIGRGRAIRFAIAAAVLLGAGWFAMGIYSRMAADLGTGAPLSKQPSPSQMVTVPDFVGTSSIDVTKTAELIGLTVVMTDGRGAVSGFLEGVVTKQTPVAGTSVDRLSSVQIEVASKTATVPTLVGTTLNSALTALNANELQLGQTSSRAVADAKPGTIVEQSQRAGAQVPAGTAVDVVVAVAPEIVVVPDVIGMDEGDARATLARARLSVMFSQAQTSGAQPRRVVFQSPRAGTRVKQGATVQLGIAIPLRP